MAIFYVAVADFLRGNVGFLYLKNTPILRIKHATFCVGVGGFLWRDMSLLGVRLSLG